MTTTDTQLKQSLARMLPDIVFVNTPTSPLRWRERPTDTTGCELVLDTELLHLCWLVEEKLEGDLETIDTYKKLLNYDVSAPWQQRIEALLRATNKWKE
jgi:hypothetical protein